MRAFLLICLVAVLACSGPKEPSTKAISQPASASKVEPPALPASPALAYHLERHPGYVELWREDERCLWLEYTLEGKGLRLRSDRLGCRGTTLTESATQARGLIAALEKQLPNEFHPESFGLGDYPELYERLAPIALASPRWDQKRGRPKQGHVNAFVAELATDPSLYPEVVALFAPSKLEPRFGGVEKVFVGPVSETPFAAALLAEGVSAGARVPYGSTVWFRLSAAR